MKELGSTISKVLHCANFPQLHKHENENYGASISHIRSILSVKQKWKGRKKTHRYDVGLEVAAMDNNVRRIVALTRKGGTDCPAWRTTARRKAPGWRFPEPQREAGREEAPTAKPGPLGTDRGAAAEGVDTRTGAAPTDRGWWQTYLSGRPAGSDPPAPWLPGGHASRAAQAPSSARPAAGVPAPPLVTANPEAPARDSAARMPDHVIKEVPGGGAGRGLLSLEAL